ncbi:MAG: thiamine-binding protein [Acidobacteriota bacterium]
MLVEFSILPLGAGDHLSGPLAEILKIVDTCGLPYKLTPGSTCVEGEWQEVMEVVRLCHLRMRNHSKHVITTIKIEDEEGVTNKITRNITSVEAAAGRKLST